jgi:site-specific recombinase XerD
MVMIEAVEVLPTGERSPARPVAPAAQAVGVRFLAGFDSPRTVDAYGRDLRDWFAWCHLQHLEPLAATRVDVDLYARTLKDDGRAPSTIARRLSTLASYYRYAVEEGFLASASPLTHVRRPSVADDSPTLGLDRNELKALLDAAQAASARDYALACLLAYNGLRISEALDADVDDLATVQGHRTLAITRKGGRRALVALAPRTVDALDTHLEGRTTGPLFPTRSGRRLDRHAAGRMVVRAAKAAGVDHTVSPHSLRHTFVTLAREAGASLEDVQDAAGHADPRTTRRYDRARHNLDKAPTYALAAHIAGAA